MAETSCRVCGGDASFLLEANDRNRGLGHESFAYDQCRSCGSVQLRDRPADLERWYAGAYHGLPAAEDLPRHAQLERDKLEMVRRFAPGDRLVEIGPSFGAFSFAARNSGFRVTAIEMDAECCAYLRDVVGVDVIRSATPENVVGSLAPVDVVALWHVLEHMPDPVRTVRQVAEALAPGGVLAVAVPNPESLQFRVLRSRWAHLDAPRHFTLVPHHELVRQARNAGLEPVSTTTTDAFGRHCNRFGWEYAMRRRPAGGPSSAMTVRASQVMQKALAPIEARGLQGAAYSVVFRRPR